MLIVEAPESFIVARERWPMTAREHWKTFASGAVGLFLLSMAFGFLFG